MLSQLPDPLRSGGWAGGDVPAQRRVADLEPRVLRGYDGRQRTQLAGPATTVEQRRYRLRFLNGCNSRFVILRISASAVEGHGGTAALPFWQIGAEGGFLPAPVKLDTLLMSPAERADVIVDFTGLTPGHHALLINEGPDEPFKGFNPDGTLADGEGGVLPPGQPKHNRPGDCASRMRPPARTPMTAHRPDAAPSCLPEPRLERQSVYPAGRAG